MKVEIGGVTYIGAELVEPYFSLWSRWLPLSDPPRPYTHIMRRHWRWTLIAALVLAVWLISLLWDSGKLRWWARVLVLAGYTALVAILAHDFWCGAEIGEAAYPQGGP